MITFKEAKEEDCRSIFQWRNHPEIRRYFLDSRELTFNEHEKWFAESLKREDRIILIAHDGTAPVGIIRFDFLKGDPGTAEIDIYVAPELHGKGYGKKILTEGERWLKKRSRVKGLIARVKDENKASMKMFRHCGFIPEYILLKKETGKR